MTVIKLPMAILVDEDYTAMTEEKRKWFYHSILLRAAQESLLHKVTQDLLYQVQSYKLSMYETVINGVEHSDCLQDHI